MTKRNVNQILINEIVGPDRRAKMFLRTSPAAFQSRLTYALLTASMSSAPNEKKYLNVSFREKEKAKSLGARWDPVAKLWHDPSPGGSEQLSMWRFDGDLDRGKQGTANSDAERGNLEIKLRRYLDVPFEEHTEARKLGARWDTAMRQWYDPTGINSLLDRWNQKATEISELKGEDRTFGGNGLFVDLVPSSCWFTNVRYCVHPADWDRLRRHIYSRAGGRCECCAAAAPLEAHERWDYDAARRVQRLARLVALCRPCHEATHMGLAELRGRADAAKGHLRRVAGLSAAEAAAHVDNAFRVWAQRSQVAWELDLSVITDSGVRIVRPVARDRRPAIAEDLLAAREDTPG